MWTFSSAEQQALCCYWGIWIFGQASCGAFSGPRIHSECVWHQTGLWTSRSDISPRGLVWQTGGDCLVSVWHRYPVFTLLAVLLFSLLGFAGGFERSVYSVSLCFTCSRQWWPRSVSEGQHWWDTDCHTGLPWGRSTGMYYFHIMRKIEYNFYTESTGKWCYHSRLKGL